QSSAPQPPRTSTGTRPNPTTAPPPATSTNNPAPPLSSSQPPATSTTVAPPPFDPHTVPVRVLNNSTTNGAAERAATKFRNAGWNVINFGNLPESKGRILTTTAYFQPGTNEEAAARALANQFSMRADVRFPGIANETPGAVIVIITNDFDSK